ncbi:putative receptor-like protein kinase At5g39000 [Bidens hawaiensis]|uniref:putative receptor-like protein kinase At5g39000 n=1 Tax=Bidens hawaiensis TaxID=980011 RepID=UPI00404B9A20
MAGLRRSKHLKLELKDIQLATQNFANCVGNGGFGSVYKGELAVNGEHTTVAVKRLTVKRINEELVGQGLKEFLTEIKLLGALKHENLISLLGFCEEGEENILVYEYAEHGSLDRYIRRFESSSTYNLTYNLTWVERLKICADAARGLDHLHRNPGKGEAIIHRDIKSANILLDKNWIKAVPFQMLVAHLATVTQNTFLVAL